jgi:hypothetical protein
MSNKITPVTLSCDYDKRQVKVTFKRDHQVVGTVTFKEKCVDVNRSTNLTLDERHKYTRAAKGFCAKRLQKIICRLGKWPHPVSEEDREDINRFIGSARHTLQAVN